MIDEMIKHNTMILKLWLFMTCLTIICLVIMCYEYVWCLWCDWKGKDIHGGAPWDTYSELPMNGITFLGSRMGGDIIMEWYWRMRLGLRATFTVSVDNSEWTRNIETCYWLDSCETCMVEHALYECENDNLNIVVHSM